MGRKDASATKLPVDQYRKQIGKQDYKKTKSVLKATRLKAEAKKNSSGFRMHRMRTSREEQKTGCEIRGGRWAPVCSSAQVQQSTGVPSMSDTMDVCKHSGDGHDANGERRVFPEDTCGAPARIRA
ncbi:triple QxxK/R motif-containing protein isoform X1 [Dunckerocampus dactyliophorus]|uniref:triple QxxK/R motif-containing protein isoform X1 n=1 Tax=Dunckerocampus dactyliophorus TaxID=161453 RepID=UPI0024059076|nr:triple QxxK/R motif-containing protein isoform X1 [Dunckerocampus dactyliophorus]